MSTTTEVTSPDTLNTNGSEQVSTNTGGEQLPDPSIVAADAAAAAAPVPGPVNPDPLNSNGTQTVKNN